MKKTKKVTALILLAGLFCVLSPQEKIQAANQFAVGYDISFVFEDNGQARVTHKISLTNQTPNLIADKYSLTISSDKVSDVSGSDALGALNISIKKQEGSTILIAKLNQQIFGLNKTVRFQISYLTDSLAIKRGLIWEVNIPQIVTSENVSGYRLEVSVPNSFGKLGKMTPTPDEQIQDVNRQKFIYNNKSNINSFGIGASFGDFQLFKFKLKYRYKNSNLYNVKVTIALPPDTEYQALYYDSLDPKPLNWEYDSSGNYLASYSVKRGANLEVIASGVVQIFNSEASFQTPTNWSKEQLDKFIKADKFIESNSSQIQKKAKELKDIKEIYDFVTSTLKYDFSRLENDSLGRRGALQALTKPEQSICTDFTDLFVALARAKGIPARGLVGFAYTDNTNLRPTKLEGLINTTVLHAWPEYYDYKLKRWVQVDPTWGSTTGGIDYFNKLDTNHFVFVINGEKSTFPIPAGGYKTSENQIDDVKVEFTDKLLNISSDFSFKLNRETLVAGFPGKGTLSVQNKSGRALFLGNLTVKTEKKSSLISPEKFNTGLIMPFETRTLKLNLRSNSLFDLKTEKIDFTLSGKVGQKDYSKTSQTNLKLRPFFSVNLEQIILLILLLIVTISFFIPLFSKNKQRNSLR